MPKNYIYGEVDGCWIFLSEETVDSLIRLWEALEEAENWGELRQLVGGRMFAVLLRIIRLSTTPPDHTPFECVSVFRRFVDEWTSDRLIEIMVGQLPHMGLMKLSEETLDLVKKCFATSTDAESRTVLQLAGHGHLSNRDDDKIAKCLAGPASIAEG